jgi:hypothetical protein
LNQSDGSIGPANARSLRFHLSSISYPDSQQIHSISGSPVLFDSFPYGSTVPVTRNVPSAGLSGRWETTVLASGVDFGALLNFPAWTAQVFIYAGLCLLLLGLMAWLGSHRLQRRTWGRRLALSGCGLFVVGSAWSTFLNLLTYVLG